MSFSATGVFTTPGTQTVFLTGSGTPVAGGTYTFQTQSLGATGCVFVIYVNSPPPPQAVYDLGGPGACNSTTIAGSYDIGIPVSASNTVSFSINVISVGSYSIYTGNSINGLYFVDSGYFATTGPRIVLLHAYGTAINTGTYTYTPIGSNGTVGCTFTVTPTNSGNNAVFTFEGAPNACITPVVAGTYTAGTPLNSSNTVTVTVNVTTAGAYTIQAGGANSMNFSKSGIFTGTGVQTVVLEGSGTPVQSGMYTFLPSGAGATGCPFIIQVN